MIISKNQRENISASRRKSSRKKPNHKECEKGETTHGKGHARDFIQSVEETWKRSVYETAGERGFPGTTEKEGLGGGIRLGLRGNPKVYLKNELIIGRKGGFIGGKQI